MNKQIKKLGATIIVLWVLLIHVLLHALIYIPPKTVMAVSLSDVVESKSVTQEPMQIEEIDDFISINKVVDNEVYLKGWINTNTLVRELPDLNATILTTYNLNTPIIYADCLNGWAKIKNGIRQEYVPISFISKTEIIEEKDNINILTAQKGVNYGPQGKETYYNLPMNKVISYMEDLGYYHDYWVRDDGVKMYGNYIMIAANTKIYRKGTLLQTSLGLGMVCDHCVASETNTNQIDIAVTW